MAVGIARGISSFIRILCIPAGVIAAGAAAGSAVAAADGIIAAAVPAALVALAAASYLTWAGWLEWTSRPAATHRAAQELLRRAQESPRDGCPWAGLHTHAPSHPGAGSAAD